MTQLGITENEDIEMNTQQQPLAKKTLDLKHLVRAGLGLAMTACASNPVNSQESNFEKPQENVTASNEIVLNSAFNKDDHPEFFDFLANFNSEQDKTKINALATHLVSLEIDGEKLGADGANAYLAGISNEQYSKYEEEITNLIISENPRKLANMPDYKNSGQVYDDVTGTARLEVTRLGIKDKNEKKAKENRKGREEIAELDKKNKTLDEKNKTLDENISALKSTNAILDKYTGVLKSEAKNWTEK